MAEEKTKEVEYKPGDIVHLKSGSHKMTVESVEDGKVFVVYSSYSDGQIRREVLLPFSLKRG